MGGLFLHIFNASINAGWIVLVVVALRLALKRAPKWVNCVLWAMVAVRLVIPVSLESALSLVPRAETVPVELMEETKREDKGSDTGFKALDNVLDDYISDEYVVKENIIYTLQEYEKAIEVGSLSVTEEVKRVNGLELVTGIASVVWIAGLVVMFTYWMVSYVRLSRRMRTSTLLKLSEWEGLRIKESENVLSPFILGIIKPTIYLPYNMEAESMKCVLAHEEAHIKRRDYIIKPVAFILLTVYWFNPLMWIAYVLLCRDIEYACDEKVIKDMPKEERQKYSKAILKNSVSRSAIVACPVAFGEVGVKERVKSVINYKKPAFWLVMTAVMVCVVVAVCFLTNPINSANAENGTIPENESVAETQSETKSDNVVTPSTDATEAEKLYDLTVEKKIAQQIAIEFTLPSECKLEKGSRYINDETAIILPEAYKAYGNSRGTGKLSATGVIEVLDAERFTFSDAGELTGGIPLSNHASCSGVETLNNMVWPAMISYWDYDLYTIVEEAELKEQGVTLPYTTSQYWTIYFVSPNRDQAFSLSLAANKFTKEQAVNVAKSVKVVDINSKATAGKTRFEYQNIQYCTNFNYWNYATRGLNAINVLQNATYCGKINKVISTTCTAEELEELGIKSDAKIYTRIESNSYSMYIQSGDENEALSFHYVVN